MTKNGKLTAEQIAKLKRSPKDIEWLIQWAVDDELRKGRSVSEDLGFIVAQSHNRPRMFRAGFSTETPQPVRLPGQPHKDALKIKAILSEVPTRMTIESELEAMALFESDLMDLVVDFISSLMKTISNPQLLLVKYGAMRSQPKWRFEELRPSPIPFIFKNASGDVCSEPLVRGLDQDKKLVDLKPIRHLSGRAATMKRFDINSWPRCPIQWSPSPLEIGEARAHYIAWHFGLRFVAGRLLALDEGEDALERFRPTRPTAPLIPWLRGQSAPIRVLDAINKL